MSTFDEKLQYIQEELTVRSVILYCDTLFLQELRRIGQEYIKVDLTMD